MFEPTIYIDDSGWGSLLGGVMIGMYNNSTELFYYKLIPVKFFRADLFSKKRYQREAMFIVEDGIEKIGSVDNFVVCRGFVLDKVYEWLHWKENKYCVNREEIGDPLQSYLEKRFSDHLKRLKVPGNNEGAHRLSFQDQLGWVKENPSRTKHVKTGWNSWQQKYSKDLK